jgi:hypothetical protein
MPRRRSTISALRSLLYGLARLLGDVQAVRRGPEVVGQRLMRRAAGKGPRRMRGRWVRLVACVLLTGCGLAFTRLSKDSQKPTVKFATPAAWGCARQTQTLPTPQGYSGSLYRVSEHRAHGAGRDDQQGGPHGSAPGPCGDV